MILYPAIDLKEGKCVRLLQGEIDKATTYGDNPAAQAKAFADAGFEWLHIVDLNGAFEGKPVNASAVKSILAAVTVPVQLGGGIRNMDAIAGWLEAGVSRVILGTLALRNPQVVREACRLFPDQIAVGIDARDGKVAVAGWAEKSAVDAADLALKFEDAGVAAIIYTDIARDGAKQGPNLEETMRLAEKLTTPVILSGGISSVDDIKSVYAEEFSGIGGIIIGRALYDGAIEPKAALAAIATT